MKTRPRRPACCFLLLSQSHCFLPELTQIFDTSVSGYNLRSYVVFFFICLFFGGFFCLEEIISDFMEGSPRGNHLHLEGENSFVKNSPHLGRYLS